MSFDPMSMARFGGGDGRRVDAAGIRAPFRLTVGNVGQAER
jgi:hypothetical protein